MCYQNPKKDGGSAATICSSIKSLGPFLESHQQQDNIEQERETQ